jgi:uncharacterized protein (TIGR03083 family)
MTNAAVDALRTDHEALVDLVDTFTEEEWAAPSACEGWSVRDVLAHMTQLWRQVVDPGALPPPDPSGNSERTQDRWVEALRDVPVAEVVADYRKLGEQAIVALAGLQELDAPMDLGDLGTHPLHLVANAFSFDHYTHIRADLLAPRGPLDRPAPPAGEKHLAAAADWIVAGIPQMTPAAVTQPVELVLTGPGARTARFGPDGDPVATVTSTVPDLVLWSTRRQSWRDLDVHIDGDTAAAEHFCDEVHVF